MSSLSIDNLTSDLFFYALHGNVPGILASLHAGAAVNTTVPGIHLIFFALRETLSEEMQKTAWQKGFEQEVTKYCRARTPLLLATEFDRYEAVLTLLDNGADPNFADEDGTTPLWAAAHRGQANIARALLRAGADVHAEDCEGQTPLFRAVTKGDLETVRLLLVAGAEANKITPFGITALLLATRRGKEIAVRDPKVFGYRHKLLSDQHEARLASIAGLDDFAVLFPQAKPWRAMEGSLAGSHPAIVAELLAHGADATYVFPYADRSIQGTTALHEAASSGCEETVRLLLDHGAELNAETALGITPLGRAACSGNSHLVQWLLDKGATGNSTHRDNFTPLMSAVVFGQAETVNVLLENGADFTLKRTTGEDVMHRAAESNNPDAIRLLVAKGADVDSRDRQQRTPLMIAVKRRAVEAIQVLLAAGADAHAVDEAGKSAWDMGLIHSLARLMQGGRRRKRRPGNFVYFAMGLWLNGHRKEL